MLSSGDKSIPPNESDEAEHLPNPIQKTNQMDKPRYAIHYIISSGQIQLYFLNGSGKAANPIRILTGMNITVELQLEKSA